MAAIEAIEAETLDTLQALLPTLATLHNTIKSHLADGENANFAAKEAALKAPVTVVGLKRDVLLQYDRDLLSLIKLRCQDALAFVDGEEISAANSAYRKELVDRLNEQRVLLEKLRPMSKKVKYAVDKLLSDNNNNEFSR